VESLADNNSFIPTRDLFITYITDKIIVPHQTRYNHLFDTLLRKMSKDLDDGPPEPAMTIYNGFNTEKTTKLDTYHFFKAFNDKWVGGNSLGQRHLIEDFLFLDRANKDIGDELFLSLEKTFGIKEDDRTRLDIKLTREEIASMVGTASETVIRFITEFKDEGLIEQEGKTIYIINQEKLLEFANINY
jgi:hypothetical protein